MDTVTVKRCVITTLTRRGKGVIRSPIRVITEMWDAETGEKIAEFDPDLLYDCVDDTYHRVAEVQEEGGESLS